MNHRINVLLTESTFKSLVNVKLTNFSLHFYPRCTFVTCAHNLYTLIMEMRRLGWFCLPSLIIHQMPNITWRHSQSNGAELGLFLESLEVTEKENAWRDNDSRWGWMYRPAHSSRDRVSVMFVCLCKYIHTARVYTSVHTYIQSYIDMKYIHLQMKHWFLVRLTFLSCLIYTSTSDII